MGYLDRTLGRQAALQFLFGLDYSPESWNGQFDEFWEMDPLALSRESFGKDEEPAWSPAQNDRIKRSAVREHALSLSRAVLEHQDELDHRISEAIDNWSPERVGRVEWIILRLGLCEMEFLDSVPAQVAINEAINLAKMFCAEESPGFVNAVLDRLRRGAGQAPENCPGTPVDE